ncbi:MAG: M23 family metallopeptidase [Gammaproteobacteria bacterium]|nr:M23 family metallopeptidase [Gammaproteobacteria bacterium]MBU1447399.1 M23 family metallopeptidase [Gammaproteobacteria bacterium]MDD2928652.1 M23 family metallopeptidase [Sideroxydans sp.]MDD5470729.1 M23 family metallopeptidase [Sideroxydans sp.]
MNIILVSNSSAKARSLTLTGTHMVLAGLVALGLFIAAVLMAQYAIVRFQSGSISNELRSWLASAQDEEMRKQELFMRQSLDAMAVRLGQMQAQLQRLDGLGARLAKLSGMKPQEFSFGQKPAQGGPLLTVPPQQDISLEMMMRQLDDLNSLLGDRSDKLVALETLLQQDKLDKKMLPSVAPITVSWYSSNFGWRIDPFTGKNAMHEGVDYMVPVGTPVYASAGGVVVFAGMHPQYGNMVEIDHGNQIITRYAHASKLLVKVGEVVRRGHEIAKVGSTGRSTGNHLHFEVRYRGTAQNPVRFLEKAAS